MKLLNVKELEIEYPSKSMGWHHRARTIKAIRKISFNIKQGETLGIVGESGCGKSSLARSLVLLTKPKKGTIEFRGEDIFKLKGTRLKSYRRSVQMIFQDPYASLNPRRSIGMSLIEALTIHRLVKNRREAREQATKLLEKVGLEKEALDRFPHELSGGQRQRIGIARALAVHPELLICDEPVSALDVSIQAQILNLLADLQKESRLSYLFITHDLAVVEHLSHRLLVMYWGEIIEEGQTQKVIHSPKHPYTQALIAALPGNPRKANRIETMAMPSSLNPPNGCAFHPRCPFVKEDCRKLKPDLTKAESYETSWRVACHLISDSK